jgi:hypothetical protein
MRDTFWVGTYPGLDRPMLDYVAVQIAEATRSGNAGIPTRTDRTTPTEASSKSKA